jgi:glutathione peroxidase
MIFCLMAMVSVLTLSAQSIYDFKVINDVDQEVSLSEYKGKVLLIVNTATRCGFTPQYKELEALYEKYRSEGLEILDFPCNQFANQAPGTEAEIVSFCKLKYDVTFPQFKKIEVNGANEAPLYTWLKQQKGGIMGSNIKWNFTKFLVDREGNVVERFAPTVTPEKIEEKVKALL